MKKQNPGYLLRMPMTLKTAVAKICEQEGTSINQFVSMAVAEKIAVIRTAEFFAERSADADVDAARKVLNREGGLEPELQDHLDKELEPGGEPERTSGLTCGPSTRSAYDDISEVIKFIWWILTPVEWGSNDQQHGFV